MVPAFRNLSINPCFEKPIKFIETSPREHFLVIIDELSKLALFNLKQKVFLPLQPKPDNDTVNCIKWLNNGQALALGTNTGKVIILSISRERELSKTKTLTPKDSTVPPPEVVSLYCDRDYIYSCASDFTITKTDLKDWRTFRITELKGSLVVKMAKIEQKKFKDIIFGIDKSRTELLMLDEVTGFYTVIFSIAKQHLH
jgi:WD40 repeat protein